jgi:hypothetical protein
VPHALGGQQFDPPDLGGAATGAPSAEAIRPGAEDQAFANRTRRIGAKAD